MDPVLRGPTTLISALIAAAVALPTQTQAEMVERTGTFGGLDVSYKLVLPDDDDHAAPFPVVLHLVGGPQTMEIVESSTATDWQSLAEERGVVIVSPASPNGELFFRGADVIFPDFLDFLVEEFDPPGGKLHITGHSNGGLSAFHVASLYPEYFVSVTGYPGLLNDETRLDSLSGLCLFMHVGDQDPSWLRAMEAQVAALERSGQFITFTVEPDQIHRLDTGRDTLADRLFAELESARAGCT